MGSHSALQGLTVQPSSMKHAILRHPQLTDTAAVSRGSLLGIQHALLSARPHRRRGRHVTVLAYRSRSTEESQATVAETRQQRLSRAAPGSKQALLNKADRAPKQEQLPLLIASNVASFRRRRRQSSPTPEQKLAVKAGRKAASSQQQVGVVHRCCAFSLTMHAMYASCRVMT